MKEVQKSYLKLLVLFLAALGYAVFNSHILSFFGTQNDHLVEVVLTAPNGDKVHVQAEMAVNDEARSRGLMYRREMAVNEGMLFVWKDTAKRSFWMKNTFIPLDMIFISGTNVVGVVQNAVPHSLEPRTVDAEANAVLEVNADFAKMYNITKGWKVSYAISDVVVE